MPRLSRGDLEQAVLDILPQDGTPTSYTQVVDQLNQTGLSSALPLIRGLKKRGLISMAVRTTESGELVHEIKKEG